MCSASLTILNILILFPDSYILYVTLALTLSRNSPRLLTHRSFFAAPIRMALGYQNCFENIMQEIVLMLNNDAITERRVTRL